MVQIYRTLAATDENLAAILIQSSKEAITTTYKIVGLVKDIILDGSKVMTIK